MIIYFVDRNLAVLGMATTSLQGGLIVEDDERTEDIDTGIATFNCVVSFRDDNRIALEAMTRAGNYILRSTEFDAECFTIIDAETNTKTKERTLTCEDAGLDLINSQVGEYTATAPMTIAQYIELFAGASGFEVGRNEIPEKTRTLSWDGTSTATARLRSVATQFDNAELSYRFVVDKLSITSMYIDIWEQRGTDVQQELRLDREIDGFRIKESVQNLFSGLEVTGGTPEGSQTPITLSGVTYDDGDIYVANGNLYSRSSASMFHRIGGESYIMGTFSYDTTNRTELLNRAIAYLKTVYRPAVNYEVDITRGLEYNRIGDRLNLVDEKGEVYVSARILKLTTSETRYEKKATLGEFLIKDSGIADKVNALAERIESISVEAQDFYSLTITSSAGWVFTDTYVNTTLSASVLLNGVQLTQADLDSRGMAVNWYDIGTGLQVGTGLSIQITGVASANLIARLEATE